MQESKYNQTIKNPARDEQYFVDHELKEYGLSYSTLGKLVGRIQLCKKIRNPTKEECTQIRDGLMAAYKDWMKWENKNYDRAGVSLILHTIAKLNSFISNKITPKPNGLKKPVIIPKRNGTLRVATLRA